MPFTVSGLNGGIDFNQLADAIIDLEREPIRRLEDRKTQLGYRQDLFKEIVSALKSVRNAAEALAKPTSLKLMKTTSGKESALTATASTTAAIGSYQVTVNQLATATRVTSGFATQLGISAPAVLDQPLNSAAAKLGTTFTDGYFTINGTQVTVAADTDTVQNLIDRINAQVAGVTASYDAATDRLKLTSAAAIVVGAADDSSDFLKKTGLTNAPSTLDGPSYVRTATHRLGRIGTSTALGSTSLGTAVSGTGAFKINGVEVTWNASTDSLNDVISRINTKVTGVVASYDSQTDKLLLVSKETGSLGLTRSDVSGNLLAALGLRDAAGESQAVVAVGQNAKLTIPGMNGGQPIYSTSNTVTAAIPGVSLTLKQAGDEAIDLQVARDPSDLKDKLRAFVSAFNNAASLMHGRLTEEPIEGATAVSTQRIGLLRGDSLLARAKAGLTNTVLDKITGLPTGYQRLGNLGIGLDPGNYKVGTLRFDESKFDALFEENYEAAYDILFNDSDGDGKIDSGETGAMPKLLSELDNWISDTEKSFNGTAAPVGRLANRISSLGDESEFLESRIEDLEARLADRETVLRAQFLAAQRAISQLQANQNGLNAFAAARSSTLGYG